jgi:hypothetical protein
VPLSIDAGRLCGDRYLFEAGMQGKCEGGIFIGAATNASSLTGACNGLRLLNENGVLRAGSIRPYSTQHHKDVTIGKFRLVEKYDCDV